MNVAGAAGQGLLEHLVHVANDPPVASGGRRLIEMDHLLVVGVVMARIGLVVDFLEVGAAG